MPVLRRTEFVRAVETELQRRGYVRAGPLPGICEWRRLSAWQRIDLGLRIEIRKSHELRLRFPDGRWKSETPKDITEAIKIIGAAEIRAEFPD